MVFLRAKAAPCLLGFFFRREDGSTGSSCREFRVEKASPPSSGPSLPAEQELEEAPKADTPPEAPRQEAVAESPAGPVHAEAAKIPVTQQRLPVLPDDTTSHLSHRTFFGLSRNPFSQSPDPAFLYWSPQHKKILASLPDGVQNRKGPIVLTGEAGTGKTTLLGCFGDFLTRESIEFAFLLNSSINSEQFYEMIAYYLDLGCERLSKANVIHALRSRLVEQAMEDRTAALIVDDAQDLEWDVLEEIRLLDNLENRKGKLLQTILCGLPELDRKLGAENLRQLRQRVMLRCRLQPLREEDTIEYITARHSRNQTVEAFLLS